MAIPINEDPYSSGCHNSNQFWLSLENLASDVQLTFYRPESIDAICKKTKFSKREIQHIYRTFKQVCPIGVISKSQFEEIFVDIFPNGNPKRYSELVFRTFDNDDDGRISFEEFIMGLSVITRGSLSEKLNWVFTLYDVKKRNRIGYSEMLYVLQSVYDLQGRVRIITPMARRSRGSLAVAAIGRSDIVEHVNQIFNKLCKNGEMQIERDVFIKFCMADTQICESLSLLQAIFCF